MRVALVLCLLAQTATAEQVCALKLEFCQRDCVEISVRFEIDRTQFVQPQDPGDPPRRQVTRVTMDTMTFQAQALLFSDGMIGFHSQDAATGDRLMIVQRDGTARLVLQPDDQVWIGTCVT